MTVFRSWPTCLSPRQHHIHIRLVQLVQPFIPMSTSTKLQAHQQHSVLLFTKLDWLSTVWWLQAYCEIQSNKLTTSISSRSKALKMKQVKQRRQSQRDMLLFQLFYMVSWFIIGRRKSFWVSELILFAIRELKTDIKAPTLNDDCLI